MLAAFRSRNSIEVECVHGQGVIFILHMGYKSIGKKEVQLSDCNNHIARGWRGIFFFFFLGQSSELRCKHEYTSTGRCSDEQQHY
jgi:hypothetical protein